jgi:hypothetical protein
MEEDLEITIPRGTELYDKPRPTTETFWNRYIISDPMKSFKQEEQEV